MRFMDSLRTTRRRRCAVVLVVLVFGLKSLLAPGYMFAAVDGQLRLVMCPAGIHNTAAMPSMPGMEHASGMDHGMLASLCADRCPFALAGGAAFLAAVCEPAAPKYVILRPARARAAATVPIAPPWRYHAPRGPPSLA
jgi:hypothetical protein